MLCTLKVRGGSPASDELPYSLQITAKHAVGGAGGSLSDEESYPTLADLLRALRALGASETSLAGAADALEQDGGSERWLTVDTDVQVPFETLAAMGFYMDERE